MDNRNPTVLKLIPWENIPSPFNEMHFTNGILIAKPVHWIQVREENVCACQEEMEKPFNSIFEVFCKKKIKKNEEIQYCGYKMVSVKNQ